MTVELYLAGFLIQTVTLVLILFRNSNRTESRITAVETKVDLLLKGKIPLDAPKR
jgi:hypothetical protein